MDGFLLLLLAGCLRTVACCFWVVVSGLLLATFSFLVDCYLLLLGCCLWIVACCFLAVVCGLLLVAS